MDFTPNDEHRMLADSARKLVEQQQDFEKRRQRIRTLQPVDENLWQQFAELGWLALPFAEEDGGLGGGSADLMVLLEEFGRGLLDAPFIPTVVLGGGVLRRGNGEQRQQWLPALMEGRLQMALAIEEYEQRFALENTALPASRDGDAFVLSGSKACVLNADQAELIAVLARTSGVPGDAAGLSLFLVDANSDGLEVKPHRVVNGQQGAELVFNSVRVPAERLVGEADQALPVIRDVVNEGILALGAEAMGALTVLLNDTVEYSRTRKQFGMPIGGFQALQHRMADMFMAVEQTRSLLLAATLKTAAGHDDAGHAVHALKAQLGRGGRKVAQEAVQLHGAIAMTDELSIGHYFKKLTAIDALFGNADAHLAAM